MAATTRKPGVRMSATRLMVLGMVRSHGRTHGYRIGTDLHSMGADEWANVRWGSIYHALRQLTKEGKFRAFDDQRGESGQCRTEYEITAEGEAEFLRMLREIVKNPDPHNDLRGAGIALLPALARDEAIELLEERVSRLEADYAELKPHHRVGDSSVELYGELKEKGVPSVVGELLGMWAHITDSEIAWTRGLIRRLRAGEHTMAGEEPGAWGMPGTDRPPDTSA